MEVFLSVLMSTIVGGGAPAITKDWALEAGSVAIIRPDYPGASAMQGFGVPNLSATYKDTYFVSTNPQRAVGIFLQKNQKTRFELTLGYAFGRDEDDAVRLRGMGDVENGVTLGLSVSQKYGPLTAKADLSSQVTGEGTRNALRVGASRAYRVLPQLILTSGVRMTLVDQTHNQTFFGVSSQQAARSAFASYEAAGGVQSYSLTGAAFYRLTPAWGGVFMVDAQRLTGDAADSPITQTQTQMAVTLGIMRRF